MKYDIERKTTSTDAVPEALQGTRYWYDSKTTQNGEKVYYDSGTGTYAYWFDGFGFNITVKEDVGTFNPNYFYGSVQKIVISGAGLEDANGEYIYNNSTGRHEKDADFYIRLTSEWTLFDARNPSLIQEAYVCPLDGVFPDDNGWTAAIGYEPAPASDSERFGLVFHGYDDWSGEITSSQYTIADAWYRAETYAFESFREYAGNVEERECYRGYLPQDEFGDPTEADVWMLTSGGSDEFDIERLSGSNAAWCSLRTDARIESIWETRKDAMEFSGLVLAWLKENNNLTEQGNIEWCRLTDIPLEPELYVSKGLNPRLYWRMTIPLELIYKTENVFE
jgi:hypothetical protein